MDFLKENSALFLMFFIPGFLSVKVYDMLMPNDIRNFQDSLYEIISFSFLNLTFFIPILYLLNYFNFFNEHQIWSFIIFVLIFIIMPIVWPIIYVSLFKIDRISEWIIHPIKKPWDFLFGKREEYWVIIHLKNGQKVAGKYSDNSFASSYPSNEQIYIEEVWKLNEKDAFIKAIQSSKGMLINGENILALELFNYYNNIEENKHVQ